jgi:hypothetical protein
LWAGVSIAEGIIDGIGSQIGGAAGKIAGFIGGVAGGIADGFKSVWNTTATAINEFLPDKITLRGLPDLDLPDNPLPTFLAKGGIVTRPTFAMIGEAGPEAVIPLSKFEPGGQFGGAGASGGGRVGGGTVNITVNAGMGANGTQIGAQIVDEIRKFERNNSTAWRA